MATVLENLVAAKLAWSAQMVTLMARPNYVDGAGQSFDFGEFVKRGAELDEMIAAAQGPVEVYSEH
jgi:hypothetical protein